MLRCLHECIAKIDYVRYMVVVCVQVTSLWGSKVCCANQCAKAVIHLSGTVVGQRGLDVIVVSTFCHRGN